MITRIKTWYQQRRRRKALRAIRETMALFGYDASDISDDDLEAEWAKFVERLAEDVRRFAVSTEQAGNALQRLGAALAAYEDSLTEASVG